MRKVTKMVSSAFLNGRSAKMGNTETDGTAMYLHGNKIAWWDEAGDLWIITCGWGTVTTRDRLNALWGVSVTQKNWALYLNGEEWDGKPIKIEGQKRSA
jgi:hypothetical protein